ncbi:hypothetical protein MSG28_012143 [Choristoneura fumiferana]|uniref:Uncharacterized protein n=1 Tax=Choristoneura fumiferana TaxID=7141 RepID=A0ACC0KBZ0_CHOFU|nr:hypothetical protein MSG28_012143 [Choristoneura fumiferana]
MDRVAVANNQRSLAALGENPWVVHLRLAVSTSGFLETCVASLIDSTWLLTSASCVHDARFIWARFGCIEVIRAELVLETSAVRVHPLFREGNDVALVALNRVVDFTQNIAVIPLPAQDADVGVSGNFCAYGENDDNTPGDYLSCYDVDIITINDLALVAGDDLSVSKFDVGAPLVDNGVLIGSVAAAGEDEGTVVFTRTSAYIDWIVSQTGIQLGREAPRAPGAPESIIIVDN